MALTVMQVYAGLPIISYENPTYINGNSISNYSGWSLQNGQATVTDGEGFDSSQALKLHKGGSQDVTATRTLSYSSTETIAHIDFRIKPVAVPSTSASATISVNGTHLAFVKDPESGTGATYWEALEFDASGRMLREELGNGVRTTRIYNQQNGVLKHTQSGLGATANRHDMEFHWNSVFNLSSRVDNLQNLTETFTYDGLNRLETATVTGQSANATTYDCTGNILTKSDVGSYQYAASAKPHRLTGITGSINRSYAYDANGAITSDGRRSYTWTSFNKIKIITQATAPTVKSFAGASLWSSGSSTMSFDYDASNNRIRQTLTRNGVGINNGSSQRVTSYVGSYEREEHYNSSNVLWQIRHRHSVGGFLQIKRTETSGQSGIAEVVSYFLKDHLGSTTAVLDAAGSVVERPSFDAWGKTRQSATWADASTNTEWLSSQYTNRGFTGHEQLDEIGLIHMNGRVYDPEIGRFLSPDPYVQDPEHSQNFNRYAYVLNNPLSYTDPSGHFFKKLFKGIKNVFRSIGRAISSAAKWVKENWRTVITIAFGVVMFAVGSAFLAGAKLGSFVGATSGAFGAAINGGGFKDILRGAVVGGITGAITGGTLKGFEMDGRIFEHVVGHGIVGGASNELMGGKFMDGFISSAASAGLIWTSLGKFVNPAIKGSSGISRSLVSAIVGGTVSTLGGGKFANGAYSAAFQHVFSEFGSMLAISGGGYGSKAATDAKLSQDTYRDKPIGADGYVHQETFVGPNGGRANLYTNGTESVLAFDGTTFLSGGNWLANMKQAFGFRSAQYEWGINLAGRLLETNTNLRFTGHSLGGGIASVAAIVYGRSANVYNAAGVNRNTLRGFSRTNGMIKYYYSNLDVLRYLNYATPSRVPGYHNSVGFAGLHGIGGVVKAFKK